MTTLQLGPCGEYRLQQRIATASYGEIWDAEWLAAKQPVALKLLRRDVTPSPGLYDTLKQSLAKEMQLLGSLRSGHLVRLLRAGEVEGEPVMVLERLEASLADQQPPDIAQILEWLRHIAEGLGDLHRHGWRHLDIKPGNLLPGRVSAGIPRLRIADLGASLPMRTLGHPLTGTPGWMAPEQFIPLRRGPQGYEYQTDHRADFFSLGLLFFHLVAGRLSDYAQQSLELHRLNPQHAAWAQRDRINAGLTPADRRDFLVAWKNQGRQGAPLALLETLLAPDPRNRPRDAQQLLFGLAGLQCAKQDPVGRGY